MKLTPQSTTQLNNGAQLPLVGLGVWQIPDGEPTAQAVEWALQADYRHIDTAKLYRNERGVGEGIRRSGLPREEIWVTTKLWPSDFLHPEKALQESLKKLGLEYVDLYLVHWPIPGMTTRIWKAMERLLAAGGAKSIGVSNYAVEQLAQVLDMAQTPPAVNQVKVSPFGFDQLLLDFCQEQQVVVEAYSPLTHGHQLGNQRLQEIAGRYGKSSAQILIRWALQKGTVVLPKSQSRQHIIENFEVFDFEISEADMQALDSLAH